MSMIPLSGLQTTPFVPTAFKGDAGEPRVRFWMRVPTFAIRDKMAGLLFERGLIPATTSQSRGLLIDVLYDLHEEGVADEHATFLEAFWTQQELHEELVTGWQMKEAERLFDITVKPELADKLPQNPIPPAPYSMRDQAKQSRIVMDALARSERYRTYQARFMVQQEEETEMVVRLFLQGWDGEGLAPLEARRDELDRLEADSIEAIRGRLQEEGAPEAWAEVVAAVRAQFGAPGGLEKNSGSPLATSFNPTGSQTPSGELETSDGSSTESPIAPTPASASRATSKGSRNSQSEQRAPRKKSGPTAGRS